MSLLRLLTTGKSLTGMAETEARYRMTSQRLLPHFGTGKNPFNGKTKAGTVQSEAGPRAVCSSSAKSEATCGTPPSQAEQCNVPRRGPGARTAARGFDPFKLTGMLRLKAVAALSQWMARLGRLVARPRGQAARPAIPRFTKGPVQVELALDRIKVVRNDLSDADLEVVPAKPAAAATLPAGKAADGVEKAWGRMAVRIFGAGKT